MTKLTTMMNIGREMSKKEKLIKAGAEQIFVKLKQRYPNVCLVHLYALEGAVQGIEFNLLPEERKKELKEFSDSLK